LYSDRTYNLECCSCYFVKIAAAAAAAAATTADESSLLVGLPHVDEKKRK